MQRLLDLHGSDSRVSNWSDAIAPGYPFETCGVRLATTAVNQLYSTDGHYVL